MSPKVALNGFERIRREILQTGYKNPFEVLARNNSRRDEGVLYRTLKHSLFVSQKANSSKMANSYLRKEPVIMGQISRDSLDNNHVAASNGSEGAVKNGGNNIVNCRTTSKNGGNNTVISRTTSKSAVITVTVCTEGSSDNGGGDSGGSCGGEDDGGGGDDSDPPNCGGTSSLTVPRYINLFIIIDNHHKRDWRSLILDILLRIITGIPIRVIGGLILRRVFGI